LRLKFEFTRTFYKRSQAQRRQQYRGGCGCGSWMGGDKLSVAQFDDAPHLPGEIEPMRDDDQSDAFLPGSTREQLSEALRRARSSARSAHRQQELRSG